MTKKDYELIARAINLEVNSHKLDGGAYAEVAIEALEALVATLGYKLLLDNPRFDQSKFEKACGL